MDIKIKIIKDKRITNNKSVNIFMDLDLVNNVTHFISEKCISLNPNVNEIYPYLVSIKNTNKMIMVYEFIIKNLSDKSLPANMKVILGKKKPFSMSYFVNKNEIKTR